MEIRNHIYDFVHLGFFMLASTGSASADAELVEATPTPK
jgi:hypothetical protein